MRRSLLLVGMLAACHRPDGDLQGRVVATDHYEETVGPVKRVGDVQVTLDARTRAVTLAFAPPAAGFVDPRSAHYLAPPPPALLAERACTLELARGGSAATLAPDQRCGDLHVGADSRVWIEDHVLHVELYGELGGAFYRFVFPILMGSDYAIPIHVQS